MNPESSHDFGKDIFPRLIDRYEVYATALSMKTRRNPRTGWMSGRSMRTTKPTWTWSQ